MGWFSSDPIESVGNVIEKTGQAIAGVFTNDDERLTHKEVFERIKQQPLKWAHELNLLDAKSNSWFRAGWRPGLGWVCVVSAALYFIPQYCVASYVWVEACMQALDASGALKLTKLPPYPGSDNGLWQLVALLLGGSAIRQVEKSK